MMMLWIRSGLHAGAQRDLPTGSYRLCGMDSAGTVPKPQAAAEPETTIALLDWEGPALRLEVRPAADPDVAVWLWQEDGWQPWSNYKPQHLGGLELCIGPVNDALSAFADVQVSAPEAAEAPDNRTASEPAVPKAPADASASSAACADAAQACRPQRNSLRPSTLGMAWLMVLALGLLGLAPILLARARSRHAPAPELVRITAAEVEQALQAQGLPELQVQEAQGELVVHGMVQDEAQDAAARELLRTLPTRPLRLDWNLASTVAATVDSALRAPQAHTRYLGEGRFVVEGSADSPQRIQSLAAQLQHDIGPALRALDVQVSPLRRPMAYAAVVVAGAVRYSEQPDGTKTFEEIRR
jgi:hypothetical protein